MPRPEVEDAPVAARPAAVAAEDLPALEPGDEDLLLGRWHAEGLAVHLLPGELEVAVDPAGNGMPGITDPEALALVGLAPGEGAGRAHEQLEDLGVVARVKDDEPHSLEHAGLDPARDLVAHLVMRHVAPPREDIGLLEPLHRQPV